MWYKHNVVMLPTNEKAKIGQLAILDNRLVIIMSEFDRLIFAKPQALYIISDEEIENGDQCYNSYDNHIWEYRDSPCPMPYWGNKDTLKKIIATTDMYLDLPQISLEFINEFIEGYNKSNVIKEIDVEYESARKHYEGNDKTLHFYDKIQGGLITTATLKINPNNTININQIKNSWSREEVIGILHKFVDKYTNHDWYDIYDKWIEENL